MNKELSDRKNKFDSITSVCREHATIIFGEASISKDKILGLILNLEAEFNRIIDDYSDLLQAPSQILVKDENDSLFWQSDYHGNRLKQYSKLIYSELDLLLDEAATLMNEIDKISSRRIDNKKIDQLLKLYQL